MLCLGRRSKYSNTQIHSDACAIGWRVVTLELPEIIDLSSNWGRYLCSCVLLTSEVVTTGKVNNLV